jgi:hypothetical protein
VLTCKVETPWCLSLFCDASLCSLNLKSGYVIWNFPRLKSTGYVWPVSFQNIMLHILHLLFSNPLQLARRLYTGQTVHMILFVLAMQDPLWCHLFAVSEFRPFAKNFRSVSGLSLANTKSCYPRSCNEDIYREWSYSSTYS